MTIKLKLDEIKIKSFKTNGDMANSVQGGISGYHCEFTNHNNCAAEGTKLAILCG